MKQKIILWWKKLKKELSGMSTRQKLDHLWTYYKWVLAVLVGVICMVSMLITTAKNRNIQTLLCGELVNAPITARGYQYLTDDMFLRLNGQENKQCVTLNTGIYSMGTDLTLQQHSISTSTRVQALVTEGQLDYLVADEQALMHFMNQDIFMDLREFFTPHQLEELSSRLIYLQAEEDTQGSSRVPVAVDLKDTPFAQTYMQENTTVFFSVIANTPRPEVCRELWQHIMAAEVAE